MTVDEQLNTLFRDATYIVLDLETTGGNPKMNGITEICGLKIRNGVILDKFYSLVNPRIRIPPIVRKITGITDKMLKDAPFIHQVMPGFLEFIEDHILVSHNIFGDLIFLRHFAKICCGKELSNFYLCTHLLANKLIPESKVKSLKGLGEALSLKATANHRADGDAEQTWALFDVILQRAEGSATTIEDLIRLQEEFELNLRIGWRIQVDVAKNLPKQAGVLTFYDKKGALIYFSSSRNMRREFFKFEKTQELPKALARIILRAHFLRYIPTPCLDSAMVVEGELFRNNPLQIVPFKFHQRHVEAWQFTKDMLIFYGPLAQHAIHAVEIREKRSNKIAQFSFLENLAKQLSLKAQRNSLNVPEAYFECLNFLFQGLQKDFYSKTKRDFFNLRLLFNRELRRTQIFNFQTSKKVSKFIQEFQIESVFKYHGVLFLPSYDEVDPSQGGSAMIDVEAGPKTKRDLSWKVVPVIHSLPQPSSFVWNGSWLEWLETDDAQMLVEQLKANELKHPPSSPRICDVPLLNAFLWSMQCRDKTSEAGLKFIPLEEISLGR